MFRFLALLILAIVSHKHVVDGLADHEVLCRSVVRYNAIGYSMYYLLHAPDNTMATNTLKIIDLLTWSVYLAYHLQHLCKAGQYTSSFLFKIKYIVV